MKILSQLIHPDPNGFQKNRNITNKIRLIFDVIDYVNRRNIPGAILSLDIQKAFDSIDWLFVKGMLERYQFGVNLIKWVEIYIPDPNAMFKLDLEPTKKFLINSVLVVTIFGTL